MNAPKPLEARVEQAPYESPPDTLVDLMQRDLDAWAAAKAAIAKAMAS